MSLIATVAVPASAFPLGSLLDTTSVPEATISIETAIPTGDSLIPYLWVPAAIADTVVATLETRSVVTNVSILDEFSETVLVEIEWTDGINGILASIRESDALVTDAVGTADRWTFRLWFPSYDALSQFYRGCVDCEIPIELVRLHEAVGPTDGDRFGLTQPQRSLVVAAYEAGYFDVPRETTLVELGAELGISDSAVSQRLRRGLSTLIGSTLAIDPHQPTQSQSCQRSSIDPTLRTARPLDGGSEYRYDETAPATGGDDPHDGGQTEPEPTADRPESRNETD
ncbi:helix-turn-helix domain-containing protein [Natrialba asiatica]|uniref:Bacterio-opsin activator HTH domain-containing protein n=1 Tax=Natrialba asiatica (strain ATCC 700177 / DSM 12278 / JCM 9576 / FERM P-10747 / NBRC 102637 / 172P1) TaxID=29540 RepID=M0AV72_NATA1|nr:helix-turn-helix domain-containing protein [Natrialba asiatica]ELZ02581.1 bacterio-opsin activator HTH domain-containing protein [Natrialba asiatica DSM 12278]